ncbi:MAG: hypothetical protein NWF06_03200 [Candidatus Bathyarchaeota archaeon]|nr:hypothetical protein [Candidatus Bathyarchaeum sp.]
MIKNCKRKMNLSFVIAFGVVLLLTCNLNVVGASLVSNKKEHYVLSDFLERLLDVYGKNLSEAELDKIRTQWLEQIKHNQEVIAKGADVLDFSGLKSGAYLDSVEIVSPYEPYVYVQYPTRVEGMSDYSYTHFHTDGWNEDTDTPMGGEAFVAGYMSSSAGGNVYLFAKKGTHTGTDPPWKNFVTVYASNNINAGFLQWTYIGNATITNSWPAYVFIGNTETLYSCYSIVFWTPPPYPDSYSYPDYFNCVQIDSLYATTT